MFTGRTDLRTILVIETRAGQPQNGARFGLLSFWHLLAGYLSPCRSGALAQEPARHDNKRVQPMQPNDLPVVLIMQTQELERKNDRGQARRKSWKDRYGRALRPGHFAGTCDSVHRCHAFGLYLDHPMKGAQHAK